MFWPDVEGCYSDCPTGYTKSTVNSREQCNPTSIDIFEALLTEDKTLTKNNNQLTLTGTNVVPAYQRGWYFSKQNKNAILSSNIVYGVNFSIQFWIYFDSIADYTILKKEGTPETIKIYLDTGVLKLSSYVEYYDKHFEKSAKISTLATGVTAYMVPHKYLIYFHCRYDINKSLYKWGSCKHFNTFQFFSVRSQDRPGTRL